MPEPTIGSGYEGDVPAPTRRSILDLRRVITALTGRVATNETDIATNTALLALMTSVAWTPTVTQGATLTLSNNTSRYAVVGEWVIGHLNTGFSSSGTAGNAIRVSLPVTAAAAVGSFGIGSIYDDSAGARCPALMDMTSTTQMWFADSTQASGTWALGTVTFAAALTTNDGISATFIYRKA